MYSLSPSALQADSRTVLPFPPASLLSPFHFQHTSLHFNQPNLVSRFPLTTLPTTNPPSSSTSLTPTPLLHIHIPIRLFIRETNRPLGWRINITNRTPLRHLHILARSPRFRGRRRSTLRRIGSGSAILRGPNRLTRIVGARADDRPSDTTNQGCHVAAGGPSLSIALLAVCNVEGIGLVSGVSGKGLGDRAGEVDAYFSEGDA